MTAAMRSAELDNLCVVCGFVPLPDPPIDLAGIHVYEQVAATHTVRCRVDNNGVVHVEAHTTGPTPHRLWQLTLAWPLPLPIVTAILIASTEHACATEAPDLLASLG